MLGNGTWWCLGDLHAWHIVPSTSQQEGEEDFSLENDSILNGQYITVGMIWVKRLGKIFYVVRPSRDVCLQGDAGVGHPQHQLGSQVFSEY